MSSKGQGKSASKGQGKYVVKGQGKGQKGQKGQTPSRQADQIQDICQSVQDLRDQLAQFQAAQNRTNQLLETISGQMANMVQISTGQSHNVQVMKTKVSNIEERQCFHTPDLSSVIRGIEKFASGESWGVSQSCLFLAAQAIRRGATDLGQIKDQCDIRFAL